MTICCDKTKNCKCFVCWQNGQEETQMQICMKEESAKVFLEEILLNVSRDVKDVAQAEHKEPLNAVQGMWQGYNGDDDDDN